MKILVLSDLHIDVNEDYPLSLDNKDIYTIIAGDTAGDPKEAIDWIRHNVRRGIVITGNHLVYNTYHKPIQDLKQYFATAFPKDGPITYLDQMTGVMSREVDGKLFIGTTFYTDYKLYPDIPQDRAMLMAAHPHHGMNDFHYGLVREGDKVRGVLPTDYLKWHIQSKKEMTRLVEGNPDKEVVIITHHCPSHKCCGEFSQYDEEMRMINTSYASDMEEFITAHPNIKLWITGHAHNWNCFKIGGCTILQNPRGYEAHREADHFNPNTFIDTKTWEMEQRPFRCVRWEKQRKHDFERLLYQGAFCL